MTTQTPDKPLAWARPWATARPFARPMPRAGAWYPVIGDASDERAVLQIQGKKVAIHKRLLEIRPDRPQAFTVVVRSRNTVANMAATGVSIQKVYAVCPNCTERVTVVTNQQVASCTQCGHRGQVAWWETG